MTCKERRSFSVINVVLKDKSSENHSATQKFGSRHGCGKRVLQSERPGRATLHDLKRLSEKCVMLPTILPANRALTCQLQLSKLQ
jgi:hypothetical protein